MGTCRSPKGERAALMQVTDIDFKASSVDSQYDVEYAIGKWPRGSQASDARAFGFVSRLAQRSAP
jgi:hypothetical protein